MADFREYKELIRRSVKELNETATWKWTVKILKNEVRLTNSYIKGQYEKDYFSATFSINEEEEGPIGGIAIRDCFDDWAGCLIVGEDRWSDGNLETCIGKIARIADGFFGNRY